MGVPVEQIVLGLRSAALSGLRMELVTTPGGVIVINDALQRQPDVDDRGTELPRDTPGGPPDRGCRHDGRIGDDSDAAHVYVTRTALDLGVEVIAVAAPAYGDGAGTSTASMRPSQPSKI